MNKEIQREGRKELERLEAEIKKLVSQRDAWRVILGDEIRATPSAHASYQSSSKDSSGRSPRPTLTIREAVEAVMPEFKDLEFTVGDIHSKLVEWRSLPNVSQPRARIATILKDMEDQGLLVRTFKPEKGTKPHRFKLINEDHNDLL